METIRKSIVEFFKKIRESPPKPKNTGRCAHCGRTFERPDKGEGEPILECRHMNGTTEYILRYPNVWRAEVVRQPVGGKTPPRVYLEFCEFCFLIKPRFVGINFDRASIPHYVWENEHGGYYERYEFGKNINDQI